MWTYKRNLILKFIFIIGINFVELNYAQVGSLTSVIGMTELLKAESLLITELSNYIENMEKKIKIINQTLDALKYEHAKAEIDAEAYLGNPLRSFALIKRLHSDWINYEIYISDTPPDITQITADFAMPNDKDLREAVRSIDQLQLTYHLKAEDMAMGLLNGIWYNSNFSAQDTCAIGHELFKNNKISEAIPWLNLSLNIPFDYTLYDEVLQIDQKEIHATYIKALLAEKLFTDASKAIKTAITLYPKEIEFFDLLHDLFMQRREHHATQKMHEKHAASDYGNRKNICQGIFATHRQDLHCHYYSEINAFTFLAPFKIEELSLEPYVALYYDIISDHEINKLKKIATPKLRRTRVAFKADYNAEVRTAQLHRFDEKRSEIVRRINQRIADMTGFDLSSSEPLQILNYGLGGHYVLHNDAELQRRGKRVKEPTDRRATVLIYLSDVEQGGHTVFPNLHIDVKPRKGQALVWYNIDNNGYYTRNTEHVACPVLVGSKWVLTKWIADHNSFHLGFGPIYHMSQTYENITDF